MKKDFIILDHVSYSYGGQDVLKDIHLTLEKGGSYALIGRSGSGKTTLLNLIAGFRKPERGSITIEGLILNKPRKETAFLFQELGLFPWQTVSEAVSMPLKLRGSRQEKDPKIHELLRQMGLISHMDKYPQELSGGERQRVALARTLIGEPDLLLMDEPTSALDAMTKEELQTLILEERCSGNATLLFVTHDIEEAMILGQKLLILTEEGTVTTRDNPYYGLEHAKEQLGFYEECIKLRRLLKLDV
ncbi:MAG: ssuB [Firmicutes bacterium]|nr:ssuB [Bacillota bacterium]